MRRASRRDERIILPPGPTLSIVQIKTSTQGTVRCACGHDFCDWRDSWKLHARVHRRATPAKMEEIYPRLMAPPTSSWQVLREYYCLECGTLHDVEAPTPWYPVIRDFEPDIDAFDRATLGIQVPERVEAA